MTSTSLLALLHVSQDSECGTQIRLQPEEMASGKPEVSPVGVYVMVHIKCTVWMSGTGKEALGEYLLLFLIHSPPLALTATARRSSLLQQQAASFLIGP